jgi:hypothetical protein
MAVAARYDVDTQAPEKPADTSILSRPSRPPNSRGRLSFPPPADYFSTLMPWAMLVVTALPFAALFLWLIAAYFGVEYGTPPWNTHSVPPPRLY